MDRLLALALRGGGPDNITIIVSDASDDDIVEQAAGGRRRPRVVVIAERTRADASRTRRAGLRRRRWLARPGPRRRPAEQEPRCRAASGPVPRS